MDSPDEPGRVEGNVGDEPLRELACQGRHLRAHFARDIERVGARRLEHREPGGGLAVEREDLAIGLRAELDPPDIAQAGDLAGAAGLDNDVCELGRVAELAGDVERVLERLAGWYRGSADLARGDRFALLLERRNHIRGHQRARVHLVGIEPDAHGILAGAEHDDVTHSGKPRDLVLELDGRVIGEIEAVVAPVGRRQGDDLENGG